jgi:glycosyltransferase involved in cell wall biosynthesis
MGGKERMVLELARRHDRSKLNVQVVLLGGRGSLVGELDGSDCKVHVLNCPLGFQPSLIYRLGRVFRENRIDIVHTHDDRSAIHALPAALLAGIRQRIHTLHHTQIIYGTPLRINMLAWVGRLAKTFVCVSQAGADMMRTQGITDTCIKVIHNGVDLQQFSCSGPNSAGPAITVARLSPEKDLAFLLRAVVHLLEPLSEFRLEIAGEGPCKAKLLQMAQSLGIADRVVFLGERFDIPELLSRARLYVLASRTEGVSLTLLEAMSRGLPVVATCVGGTAEIVVHGKTGLLVSSRDAAALARAIQQVWSNAGLASSLGLAGRRRVENEFDIDRAVAQYETLYLEGLPAEGSPK